MNQDILIETVATLVKEPKGILAIDESVNTCTKRFLKLSVPSTVEKRREYRELLVTAPGIEKYISGYILFDETIRQSTRKGQRFVSVLKDKGILPGIKVDTGLEDFLGHPGEKITEGLEELSGRLKEYKKLGASFCKWRAVYTIGKNELGETPSQELMKENAVRLAKYALLCQQFNLVPIVEPEVLMDGDHNLALSYEVTGRNLDILFAELKREGVYLPGVILKTSMVLAGKDNQAHVSEEDIAKMTVKCLKKYVPAGLGGVVFLSGGQADEEAARRLNAMHHLGPLPWPLSFSYGRAIQRQALESWAKNPGDTSGAQTLLVERARANSLASVGEYK